jgi:hypothetical protein
MAIFGLGLGSMYLGQWLGYLPFPRNKTYGKTEEELERLKRTAKWSGIILFAIGAIYLSEIFVVGL